MIHIDIDNETQNITLLLKSNQVTPWEYANSQTEYELKKIRQAQEQLKRVKQEELYQQKQRQRRQRRQQQRTNSLINEKVRQLHKKQKGFVDDGPDL